MEDFFGLLAKEGKVKGPAACFAQTADPFGSLNRFKRWSDFPGALHEVPGGIFPYKQEGRRYDYG